MAREHILPGGPGPVAALLSGFLALLPSCRVSGEGGARPTAVEFLGIEVGNLELRVRELAKERARLERKALSLEAKVDEAAARSDRVQVQLAVVMNGLRKDLAQLRFLEEERNKQQARAKEVRAELARIAEEEARLREKREEEAARRRELLRLEETLKRLEARKKTLSERLPPPAKEDEGGPAKNAAKKAAKKAAKRGGGTPERKPGEVPIPGNGKKKKPDEKGKEKR